MVRQSLNPEQGAGAKGTSSRAKLGHGLNPADKAACIALPGGERTSPSQSQHPQDCLILTF